MLLDHEERRSAGAEDTATGTVSILHSSKAVRPSEAEKFPINRVVTDVCDFPLGLAVSSIKAPAFVASQQARVTFNTWPQVGMWQAR